MAESWWCPPMWKSRVTAPPRKLGGWWIWLAAEVVGSELLWKGDAKSVQALRKDFSKHLSSCLPVTHQLLICFEHDAVVGGLGAQPMWWCGPSSPFALLNGPWRFWVIGVSRHQTSLVFPVVPVMLSRKDLLPSEVVSGMGKTGGSVS